MASESAKYVLGKPGAFFMQVFRGFRANQGFLLSGAIAYYTLLSIIPMMALILVLLSQFQNTHELLNVLREYLVMITPGQAEAIVQQIGVFLDNWKLIGIVGIVLMLFFSSFAFTALENAMSVMFFHRVMIKRRHFFVSAIIPYVYILLLALGFLLVSIVSGFLHSLHSQTVALFGSEWSLGYLEKAAIYTIGVIGEIVLLTSLYLVMPVGRLSFRHALLGGIAATILWELTRHLLIWYFETLSLVNIVYGAFATAIVVLISLEIAAIILLLGAQLISEYERIGSGQEDRGGLQTD